MKGKLKLARSHVNYECPHNDCNGVLELVKSEYVKRPGLMVCSGEAGHFVHPDDFIVEGVVEADVLKIVKKKENGQCVFE